MGSSLARVELCVWDKLTIRFEKSKISIIDVFVKILKNRQDRIRKEGLCPGCGVVQTHQVHKKGKVPIKSIMVYKGTCIRCAIMWPLIMVVFAAMIWNNVSQKPQTLGQIFVDYFYTFGTTLKSRMKRRIDRSATG